MWLRRASSAAIGVIGGALARPATVSAQGNSELALEWSAPSGCPSRSEVGLAVERLLGRALRSSDASGVVVRVQVQQGEPWRAQIETRLATGTGKRSLEAESCRALADATALIIALMIDPQAVAAQTAHADSHSEAPSSAPSASAPSAAPSPAPIHAETASRPAGRPIAWPLRATAGLFTAADLGTLPHLAFGGGVNVGLLWGPIAAEIGLAQWASQTAGIAGTSPIAGGHFDYRSAFFAACPLWEARTVDLGGCAEVDVAQLEGTGFGVSTPLPNRFLRTSIGAGLFGRFRLGPRLRIPVHLSALVLTDQPTFVLEGISVGEGHVYTPARVRGRASLGIAWEF